MHAISVLSIIYFTNLNCDPEILFTTLHLTESRANHYEIDSYFGKYILQTLLYVCSLSHVVHISIEIFIDELVFIICTPFALS